MRRYSDFGATEYELARGTVGRDFSGVEGAPREELRNDGVFDMIYCGIEGGYWVGFARGETISKDNRFVKLVEMALCS